MTRCLKCYLFEFDVTKQFSSLLQNYWEVKKINSKIRDSKNIKGLRHEKEGVNAAASHPFVQVPCFLSKICLEYFLFHTRSLQVQLQLLTVNVFVCAACYKCYVRTLLFLVVIFQTEAKNLCS